MDRKKHQDQRNMVDQVIPNRMVYNGCEKIVVIFKSPLPSQGSFNVTFQGRRRDKLEVKATKINPFTLTLQAPVYNPVEKVGLHVRHVSHEGSKSLGSIPFEFISRDSLMAHLLQSCADPILFMCESLGIAPSDMASLDKALSASFKANMPPGFHLLGLRNESAGQGQRYSLYPTLLHFAAAFGLFNFIKDCLIRCPGFLEASSMTNCNDKRPIEMAYDGQFMDIHDLLNSSVAEGEDIYEPMDDNDQVEEDPYYTAVRNQHCVNLTLWHRQEDDTDTDGYIGASRHGEGDDIYTPMDGGDGYEGESQSQSTEFGVSEAIYDDMEGTAYGDETCQGESESTNQDDCESECLYMNEQDLSQSDTGRGGVSHYQVPSSLPVCDMYPQARSISVSLKNMNEYKTQQRPTSHVGPPVVPDRKEKKALSLPSKPVRPVSMTSNASCLSADSGISEANIEENEEQFMSREELLKSLQTKTCEDDSPPPPPPTDYREDTPPPSRKQKAGDRRPQHRSKTLPVSTADISAALTQRQAPIKGRGGSYSGLTKRMSDLALSQPGSGRPDLNRRGSDVTSRPQLPIPSIPAGVCEEEPPAPPPRVTSKAPTPSPRTRAPRN